ncbi:hypothetical protein EVAR_29937_1 [Eumeta japonica]|uniref:Uncharacterized protein n=1 Tax=Eumeta variegata TaxID=151549 RepID=A0A4C1VFU1_EUMVA|nr:hypothetical protein EVAR_29937_1 [Eumeta japonica]
MASCFGDMWRMSTGFSCYKSRSFAQFTGWLIEFLLEAADPGGYVDMTPPWLDLSLPAAIGTEPVPTEPRMRDPLTRTSDSPTSMTLFTSPWNAKAPVARRIKHQYSVTSWQSTNAI